ncbi:thioesterase family protein, partial [Sneathiella sp.]|uniref:thioesterase family protein n=1 Tax=Sneathiella sp. TaxID=1964365 RepID=UPI00260F480C
MNETSMTLIHEQPVLPEWIDHNNHMNVAYYVLIFDHSLDEFLDEIGLTREYRMSENRTVYVLETHVTYIQEVHEGDALEMYVRVLDCDEKRMHLFLEMRHRDKGFLAATS